MARFELYGTESLFVVFHLHPQRHSALSIPVAVVFSFCCGFFLQVKIDTWKQGIMNVPQDGHSGSNSQLARAGAGRGGGGTSGRCWSHVHIHNNGPVKSGVETPGREQLVLPREIREGASEMVLGG